MRSRKSHCQRGDAVQVVAVDGLRLVVRHAGQVEAGVGLDEHAVVGFKFFRLLRVQRNARRSGALQHRFGEIAHSSSSGLQPRLFSQIISTVISPGDTPGMRLACPSDAGRCRSSFCRASMRSPDMLR